MWFGEQDTRNEEKPIPLQEKQSITRAELRAALLALDKKQPGVKLHLVTDSELVFLGLRGKCAKWERQGCVGSRGPLAHVALWTELWHRWQLLGDNVTVQWVPSHVGVQGNERADAGAAKGARQAFRAVLQDREVRDIWNDLGLEEMDEYSEDDLSVGSQDGAASDSDSDSDYVAEAAEDSDSKILIEGSDSASTDDSVPSSKRQLTGV